MTDQLPGRSRVPAWIIFTAAVVLVGFLTMLGLGLLRSSQQSLTIGSRVNDFTFTSFDGQQIPLSSLQGKKVVVNFWASWCTECVNEAQMLESAWRQTGTNGDVVFLGVDYADTEPAARQFLYQFGIDYLNGPDLQSAISKQFRITGVPETYLIGTDGTIQNAQIGAFSSVDEIMQFIGQ